MYHYLFTNDLRITTLESALKKAGNCFVTNTVPTAEENKNDNNNINTLGFYFNLTATSKCARDCANGHVRKVVLNFIKKFQFPNPRTNESLMSAIDDGITIAPMRIILQVLYNMNMVNPSQAFLTREEVRDFIFYNSAVAKTKTPNILELINNIVTYRNTGVLPSGVERDVNNKQWKQEDRQIREMMKILTWSGCVAENDEQALLIHHDNLSVENKAALFDILTFTEFWYPDKDKPFNVNKMDYQQYMDIENCEEVLLDNETESAISPEWFAKQAALLGTIDDEAAALYKEFRELFAPEVLTSLLGLDLLHRVFINETGQKDSLCHYLEYDKRYNIFGSVAGGSAYKYGLFYSHKENSWMTGSGKSKQYLSEAEAIVLGARIRDNLVAGAKVINDYGELNNLNDYASLHAQLYKATKGLCGKQWVMMYYHMLFPELFPVFYNEDWQKKVLEKISIEAEDSSFIRMGQIALFVKECGISNVAFFKLIDKVEVNDEESIEDDALLSPIETIVDRQPRQNKIHPLNSILYGAPGTGKTYSTAEYALAIIDNKKIDNALRSKEERKEIMKRYNDLIKEGKVVFTTFHQSYGYEDFIQGLRPDTVDGKMEFKTVDGVFKRIADTAMKDMNNDYVIIIDEINRANISKVFGELITLIENDKRWGETNAISVTLPSGDKFAVPNNLYILGTMNSADKSISLIDTALRRRFDFIEIVPNTDAIADATLKQVLDELNKCLVSEFNSTDLLIGHAYFIDKTSEDLCDIMNRALIPLLYEYFYDDAKKVKDLINKSIVGLNYKITDNTVGRIKLEKNS